MQKECMTRLIRFDDNTIYKEKANKMLASINKELEKFSK